MTIERLDGPGSSEDPERVLYSDVCLGCAHFRAELFGSSGRQTCEAFPKEIPAPIWNGQNRHRRPYPGDRGIVYEPLLEASRGLPAG